MYNFLILCVLSVAHARNVTVLVYGLAPGNLEEIISPSFVGFSIEVGGVLGMIGSKGDEKRFAQMLRNLDRTPGAHAGPVLRLGGNSADSSCFQPSDSSENLPKGCKYTITEADLNAYVQFAEDTAHDVNVSYVIDTNFGLSPDPASVAVAHVRALTSHSMWHHVHAVEIGNEMDIYAKSTPEEQKAKGHRNMSYSYVDYEPEFGAYVRAFKAAGLPTQLVQGGTYCSFSHRKGFDGNMSRYLNLFRADLKTFSYHRYPTSHCGGHVVTKADLMSDHAVEGQVRLLSPFIGLAQQKGVPFWIGEGNSASCGGMPGVSDTFTAALWVIDFLPAMSKAGVAGMNFHGGPRGVYPAIAFSASGALEVRPLYYGLLAFAELTANYSKWLHSTESTTRQPLPGSDPTCSTGILAGAVCCAKECGACGGHGCQDRKGGSAGCCSGTIQRSNVSCDKAGPPCVLDHEVQDRPIISHAVGDTHGVTRVLVAAKDVKDTDPSAWKTSVCLVDNSAPHTARTATMLTLAAPSIGSTYQDHITFGGQTFTSSTDGKPIGDRHSIPVKGYIRDGMECYDLDLPPVSAVLLVIG